MSDFIGWYALRQSALVNPLSRISYAKFTNGANSETGVYSEVANYGKPTGGTWQATPLSITAKPVD